MPIIRFTGRLFPRALARHWVGHIVTTKRTDEHNLISRSVTSSQGDGSITVECEANRFEADHKGSILGFVTESVRAAADAMAFQYGIGAAFVMETVKYPGEAQRDVTPGDPDLSLLSTALACEADQIALAPVISQSRSLRMALHDLVHGLTLSPHEKRVNCGRAIETLMRNFFLPNNDSRKEKEGWIALRATLRVSEQYVRPITDASKNPRHGNYQIIDDDETQEILRRSWTLMNRFLEYRKRGSQPLPEAEFPELVH